ncbi:MAG: LysM peptidoglycan-binding domain-containing protein [Verrucomicrobiota bacterium]|nr:LysM peptidoglycan-binding domain-containing protein [Chthoniobacterales bacterium]MDQ3414172.1 LysM peptidoglycan-binding domain-containing protein [Verrucomicrobiota bacterium]
MIRRLRTLALLLLALSLLVRASAQSPAPATSPAGSELLNLAKKIDEQNIKIDLLSQQILRLQQEIEHPRQMGLDHTVPAATAVSSPVSSAANTHVVARGETLTSIARQYKVTIDELQKLNRIEDATKLRAGQTLVIPGAPPAAASPSPSASAPNQ